MNVRYWKRPIESKEVNPYLYYFVNEKGVVCYDDLNEIPDKFLKIPPTALYEYGGSHEEALSTLTNAGFHDIMEVNEL